MVVKGELKKIYKRLEWIARLEELKRLKEYLEKSERETYTLYVTLRCDEGKTLVYGRYEVFKELIQYCEERINELKEGLK